jgi:hypothetical protein
LNSNDNKESVHVRLIQLNYNDDGMAEGLTHPTSNLMITSRMGSNPLSGASPFLEQKALHSLLITGWFQEQIRKCVYKLMASYTIKLKLIYE